jgi:IS5 family transposase
LKTGLFVDTGSNVVLDIHITTTRNHDTHAPQVVKWNIEALSVLVGDRGYDDHGLRSLARDNGVRPLITHREFSPLHEAWNARLDADLYNQRDVNETVNAAIEQKFGRSSDLGPGGSNSGSS